MHLRNKAMPDSLVFHREIATVQVCTSPAQVITIWHNLTGLTSLPAFVGLLKYKVRPHNTYKFACNCVRLQ